MPKFKFDYWNEQLWRTEGECPQEVPPEQKFITKYLGVGFILDPNKTNHWITFTIYKSKIRVFYKQVKANEEIIYYRQDIPYKEPKEVIELELTENDLVEKKGSKWVKKKEES